MTATVTSVNYPFTVSDNPKWSTTTGSTITGLSGMAISTDSSAAPSYSINIGGTTLKTTDIDFIHALQRCGGSNQDVVVGLQNFMQTCKANWAYIPQEYTWTTTTSGTNMPKYDNTIKYSPTQEKEDNVNMLKNFHFGPCGDRAKISHLGIAVLNSNQEWVSYDKENNEIVNVDLISFGDGNYVYMIPVALKDVAIGDAIVHNGHIMFVKSIKSDYIQAIDVTAGELKRILPTKSVFGFDFITKVVSLIDMSGMSASEDNPFGNLLPFLLLKNNKENNILPLMLMMSKNQMNTLDPMTMMLLCENKNMNENNLLPLIWMMSQQKKN